jgi:hypothetical protein
MKKPISISFSKWSIDDVVEKLGIEVDYFSTGMEYLTNYEGKPSDDEQKVLDELRLDFLQNANSWNEKELEIFFLAQLIGLVNYKEIGDGVKTFAERNVTAIVGEYELTGDVDWLISKGFGKPKAPYFCIKEFKKAKNSSNDPEGQLAAAMVAAQMLNNNQKPVYGAYLLGKDWTFCVLNDKKLVQSPTYLASDAQGLTNIFMIMKNLKSIIKKDLEKDKVK